jgi:hypothetical protein
VLPCRVSSHPPSGSRYAKKQAHAERGWALSSAAPPFLQDSPARVCLSACDSRSRDDMPPSNCFSPRTSEHGKEARIPSFFLSPFQFTLSSFLFPFFFISFYLSSRFLSCSTFLSLLSHLTPTPWVCRTNKQTRLGRYEITPALSPATQRQGAANSIGPRQPCLPLSAAASLAVMAVLSASSRMHIFQAKAASQRSPLP